mmetsp:Transcript_15951/g.34716  ORF Transcript_15951/g.34716 Transcript_15951/m.34716 type:complete len:293 (-) Transcript_15951:959-1837(-)
MLCQHIPTVVDAFQQRLTATFLFEQRADRGIVLICCFGIVKFLQPAGECFSQFGGQVSSSIQCCSYLVLHLRPALDTGQRHPKTEFGVVLKQRSPPCWATPIHGVGGVRVGGRRSSPDRRAPRRVSNHQPLAKKLRQKLDVRGLAASSACTREFEQRGLKLGSFHCELVSGILFHGFGHRKLPPRGPLLGIGVVLAHEQRVIRTGLDTHRTTGAIHGGHRDAVLLARQFSSTLGATVREISRLRIHGVTIKQERSNHSVRTHNGTVVALSALVGNPHWYLWGNATLFKLRCA